MPGNSNRERGGDTCVLSPSPLKTGTESCTCTSRGREKGGRKGVVYKRRAPDSTPAPMPVAPVKPWREEGKSSKVGKRGFVPQNPCSFALITPSSTAMTSGNPMAC